MGGLWPTHWSNYLAFRSTYGIPAAVFILIVAVGAMTSYVQQPPSATGSSPTRAGDDMMARLKDYTHAVGADAPTSTPTDGKLLPDVNTMIERLAARLETTPDDAKGWRMLGWSYFNTARYKEAAAAYARAAALDPTSAELKLAYQEAKAKASESDAAAAASPPRAEGPSEDQIAAFEAMPQRDREAAIRSMVDGLARRLESSSRDAEGWTQLMRSRVVLGEKEAAIEAFRKALDVFKDDATASGRIAATAIELGLKAE